MQNLGEASFAEFHIIGASAGDILQIGATSPLGINYIGGISLFAEAPKPSSYTMLVGGHCLSLVSYPPPFAEGFALKAKLLLSPRSNLTVDRARDQS